MIMIGKDMLQPIEGGACMADSGQMSITVSIPDRVGWIVSGQVTFRVTREILDRKPSCGSGKRHVFLISSGYLGMTMLVWSMCGSDSQQCQDILQFSDDSLYKHLVALMPVMMERTKTI